MNSEATKIIVSYWGAFIATILAIIKIAELYRDKAKIKVSAGLIFKTIGKDEDCKGTKVEEEDRGFKEIILKVSIVNFGRRSIQITSIIIETSKGSINQIIPENFPAVLQPLTSIDAEIQKEWIDQEPVNLFGVTDALGNRYRLKNALLQKLLDSTNSYPSNKKKYKRKDGKGEPVTAFQVKDKSILINRETNKNR